MCFKRNHSFAFLWWSSLQTKEGQWYKEFNLVELENGKTSSDRWVQFDKGIIERTIYLGPSTCLYRPFLKRCTLYPTSSKATWSWSSSSLIISRNSLSPSTTWTRLQMGGEQPTLTDVTRYFDIHVLLPQTILYCIFKTSSFPLAVCPRSLLEEFKQLCVSFFLNSFCEYSGNVKPVKHVTTPVWWL